MIYFAQSSSASNPTFISQYGPLIAALVALVGVLITLIVNVRKDQERYRIQREDDYRHDQRTAIAAVAVAGHNVLRECGALETSDNWNDQRAATDDAMAALLNELTVTRLLIHDETLQKLLDSVFNAWDAIDRAMGDIKDSLFNQLSRQNAVESLREALDKYDIAASKLYTVALDKLKPTVVEARLYSDRCSAHLNTGNAPYLSYDSYIRQASQVALVQM